MSWPSFNRARLSSEEASGEEASAVVDSVEVSEVVSAVADSDVEDLAEDSAAVSDEVSQWYGKIKL